MPLLEGSGKSRRDSFVSDTQVRAKSAASFELRKSYALAKDAQDLILAHDHVLFAADLDVGARVFTEKNSVA